MSWRRGVVLLVLSGLVAGGIARPDISLPALRLAAKAVSQGWEQAMLWLAEDAVVEAEHDDDDGDDDDAAPALIVAGVPAVTLDQEAQALAGIETARLEAATLVPEIAVVGEVVDIQGLIEQRSQYRDSYFRAEAADIRVAALESEHRRLAALYRDDANVAQKTVQQADAAWRAERAERNRLWDRLDSIRRRAERDWGAVLAGWAFARESAEFEGLVDRRDALILAHLPADASLAPGVESCRFAADGNRETAGEARHLSRATRSGRSLPGEAHPFLAEGAPLAAGSRVQLWVPATAEPISGLALPAGAVVHALGRAWAYVRVDDSHFVRRAVDLTYPLPDGGYLVTTLGPGAEAAVTGAVVLYAEEFRSQVRNEDDD